MSVPHNYPESLEEIYGTNTVDEKFNEIRRKPNVDELMQQNLSSSSFMIRLQPWRLMYILGEKKWRRFANQHISGGVPPVWRYANDEIINAYAEILNRQNNSFKMLLTFFLENPSCRINERSLHFFNRNTPYRDVVVPYNMHSNHWVFFYVQNRNDVIKLVYMNTLFPDSDVQTRSSECLSFMSQIKKRIVDEYNFKKRPIPAEFKGIDCRDKKYWVIDGVQQNNPITPQQRDAVSCGFFVMECAKYICMGWRITGNSPDHNDIEKIRYRHIHEVMTGNLLMR